MPVKKGIRFEIFVFRLDFHKRQLSTVNCQLILYYLRCQAQQ